MSYLITAIFTRGIDSLLHSECDVKNKIEISYRRRGLFATGHVLNVKISLRFLHALFGWEHDRFWFTAIQFCHVAIHPVAWICNTSLSWTWRIILIFMSASYFDRSAVCRWHHSSFITRPVCYLAICLVNPTGTQSNGTVIVHATNSIMQKLSFWATNSVS